LSFRSSSGRAVAGVSSSRAAAIGFAVVAGWTAFDLTVFLRSGDGGAVGELLRWSLPGALVFAGLAALLVRRPLWIALALALGAAGAWASWALPPELSRARLWLPRAACLLLTAWLAALWLSRGTSVSGPAAGFLGGVLSPIAISLVRSGWSPYATLWVAAIALWALSRALPLRALRPIATLLAALLPFAAASWPGRARASLTRQDLSPPAPRAERGPSLILIVLDTVRADHVGCYGATRPTTPHLDAFAAENATLYLQARSTSPFTLASTASLLTGLHPSQHHAARPGSAALPIRPDIPLLAELLRETGYQTAAIVANHIYLNTIYGFDRGFEHFDDRVGGDVGKHLALAQMWGASLRAGHVPYRDAGEITDAAIDWISNHRRATDPLFFFLNYLDAHAPYLPPPPFDRAFGAEEPIDPLSPEPAIWPLLYDRELRYVDEQVGRLFAALKAEGVFDDAMIVVTADHGEALGEHGIPWHNWHLFESLIHVPLLVKPPGRRAAASNPEPIDGSDVFRLVSRELGLDAPAAVPGGVLAEWYPLTSLSPAQIRWGERTGIDPTANRVAWLEGSRKLIVASTGEVQAFDLDSDPHEERPLPLGPAEVDAARERAGAWWSAHPLVESEAPALDPQRLEAMHALGYGG